MVFENRDLFYYIEENDNLYTAKSMFTDWKSPVCSSKAAAVTYGEKHSRVIEKLYDIKREFSTENFVKNESMKKINFYNVIRNNTSDICHRKTEIIKIIGMHNNIVIFNKNFGHANNSGECSFYIDDIVDTCKANYCNQVIFVHNHPDGSNFASNDDYNAASLLEEYLMKSGITLLKSAIVLPTEEIIYYNEGKDLPISFEKK